MWLSCHLEHGLFYPEFRITIREIVSVVAQQVRITLGLKNPILLSLSVNNKEDTSSVVWLVQLTLLSSVAVWQFLGMEIYSYGLVLGCHLFMWYTISDLVFL